MRRILLSIALSLWAFSAFAAVGLDGHATAHSTTTACAISPTTAGSNRDLIITGFAISGATSTGSVAITDNLNGGGGLTWTSQFSANDNAKSVWNFVFTAPAAAQITSGSVTATITITGFGSYLSCEVFGVSGANTSTPLDGSISYLSNSTAAITTSVSADFVFGMGSCTGSQSGVAPWTLMDDFITTGALLTEYQLPGGTGTFTYTFGGCTIFGGSLVGAIQPAAGGGASLPPGSLMSMGSGK